MGANTFDQRRFLFGTVACDLGFMLKEDVEDCIEIQRNASGPINIGTICRTRGYLTEAQLGKVLKEQARRLQDLLPAPSDSDAKKQPSVSLPGDSSKKVLFVDDSATVRHFAKASLSGICQLTVAPSGSEAVVAIRNELGSDPFDLILLDIEMPGMDGFALGEAIRRIPIYRNVPILFISMYTKQEYKDRVAAFGGRGLIGKPSCSSIQGFTRLVQSHLKEQPGIIEPHIARV